MLKATSAALALAITLSACASSPEPRVTQRDGYGNFVTTADYKAMDRVEFVTSIQEGLLDFDKQEGELRARANELGGSALKDFADCEMELREKRTAVVNQLSIAESALNGDFPNERASTVDAYLELRDELTDAQKEVLNR